MWYVQYCDYESSITMLRSSPSATPRGATEARTNAREDDEHARDMLKLRQSKDALIQEKDAEIRQKDADMAALRERFKALEIQVQVHVARPHTSMCKHTSELAHD